MRIGIIGVGLLGTALMERFQGAGWEVSGYDIEPGKGNAGSASEVADACPRVVLSLPTSDIVAEVLDEIESWLRAGVIVIDTTTGAPEQMAGFGERLAKRGVRYLDATIGGSSNLVRAGEAIVLCGGERETFAACEDLFALIAKKAFHVGPCGAGARMKLVLNLVLGLNRAVLAEGLSFAKACGIDPAEALEVLKAGPAYSRVMDLKGRKMLTGDFAPEARLSQHLKDVRLILESGAYLPLSSLHRELLEAAEAAGFGGADNSAVIKAYDGKGNG